MRFYSHVLFAVFLGVLYTKFFALVNPLLFFSVLLVSSLLPDIDASKSLLGRKIKPLSVLLQFFFGHRHFFHSLLFLALVYVLLNVVSLELALAALIGIASHLLLDALTPEGITPFYPWQKRLKGKIKTGGVLEYLFDVGILLAFVLV